MSKKATVLLTRRCFASFEYSSSSTTSSTSSTQPFSSVDSSSFPQAVCHLPWLPTNAASPSSPFIFSTVITRQSPSRSCIMQQQKKKKTCSARQGPASPCTRHCGYTEGEPGIGLVAATSRCKLTSPVYFPQAALSLFKKHGGGVLPFNYSRS